MGHCESTYASSVSESGRQFGGNPSKNKGRKLLQNGEKFADFGERILRSSKKDLATNYSTANIRSLT